jgi:signal transduction histidine kinase
MGESSNAELVKKYQWAGRIRFISFLLLFFFLLLMKASGGYAYLNFTFACLIFVEAILNQPYAFVLKRVNVYRFQFYQMVTDIIAISWVCYFMGGIEAPVVSIAYYAVILWAGVVSGPAAVFFSVGASAFFFSLIVLLAHFGILPHVAYFNYRTPTAQMFSILFGNLAFLFAFGYFSIHSSRVIKLLEKKRRGESLKYTHRLLAAGYLLNGIAHDMVNHLAGIRGYVRILLEKAKNKSFPGNEFNDTQALKSIEELDSKNIQLLTRLSRLSRRRKEKCQPTDLNKVIEDALMLTMPLARMSDIRIETKLEGGFPLVLADPDQMQEVFVTLILNSLDAAGKAGKITINTAYLKEDESVQVCLSDTGLGARGDYSKRIPEPFFLDKGEEEGEDLGLVVCQEIIARYNGKLDIGALAGQEKSVKVVLPVAGPEKSLA